MSKESSDAMMCPGCNRLVTFAENHAKHCVPMREFLKTVEPKTKVDRI